MKFQYVGTQDVAITGVGIVHPQEVIESKKEIDHPEFIKLDESKKKGGK